MESSDYNILRNMQINQNGSDQLKIETYDHSTQSITGVTSYVMPVKEEIYMKSDSENYIELFRLYRMTPVVFSLEHYKTKDINSTLDFDVKKFSGLFDSYQPDTMPAPYRRINYSHKIVNVNHAGKLLAKYYEKRINDETFYAYISKLMKVIFTDSKNKKWDLYEDYYSELLTL